MQDQYSQVVHELIDSDLVKQNPVVLNVTSLSMYPILQPGDRVLIQVIPIESMRRGDLLVTRRTDGFLTHRLVAVDVNGWYTKGDRNTKVDAPIDPSNIVGVVVEVDRCGKRIGLNTRSQRLLARWLSWLGWQEIAITSAFVSRFFRFLSRASMSLASSLDKT